MPAYDYRCVSCDICFEVTRPLGETGQVTCPECGSAAKRVFSPVGVVFKGSGFHNTDYRARPKNEEASPSGKDSCEKAGDGGNCSTCPAASE
jgi:putative FmdB family regulatory protein